MSYRTNLVTPNARFDLALPGGAGFVTCPDTANFAVSCGSGCGSTYTVPMSLTLYNVNVTTGALGSEFATSSLSAVINYAPTAAGDMQALTNIPISAPSAPGTFVYDLSFTPSGPSNSLNFALSGEYDSTGNYAQNGIADNTNPGVTLAYACNSLTAPITEFCDTAYWNTSVQANPTELRVYSRGIQVGSLAVTVCGYGAGLIAFDATPVPEPATLGLIGFGLMAFAAVARKKNRS